MLMKIVAMTMLATGLAFTASGESTSEQLTKDCCKPDGSSECCVLELPCCDQQANVETGKSCCSKSSESVAQSKTLAFANACCDPDRTADCCVLELPCCDGQDCCGTGQECCELNLACCDK